MTISPRQYLPKQKKIQTTTETDMLENPELNLRNYRKPFFTRGVHFRRQPIEQMKSFWKIHDVWMPSKIWVNKVGIFNLVDILVYFIYSI